MCRLELMGIFQNGKKKCYRGSGRHAMRKEDIDAKAGEIQIKPQVHSIARHQYWFLSFDQEPWSYRMTLEATG